MLQKLSRPLQALLLDDEIDACKNLQSFLNRYWKDKIEIYGYALNTLEAEKLLAQVQPDVVFIDIEMPGENAFQFLDRIQPLSFEIIFVTAYDEYALRALKLNAVDYILKPISIEELETAIHKLEEKIILKQFAAKVENQNNFSDLRQQMMEKTKHNKILLKNKTGMVVINFSDILYLEAEGSYTTFYFKEGDTIKSLVMSNSIVDYEELLPVETFFRIHKSYLVNCKQINRVLKQDQNLVVMNNLTELPLSRRRYLGLVEFLKALQ